MRTGCDCPVGINCFCGDQYDPIDVSMIRYFYFEKGDPTRWSGWNLSAIKHYHPELAHAYEQMEATRKIFEIVLNAKAFEQELNS